MSLEWQLDETSTEAESYNFQNVNPKVVFLLALAASFTAVCCIYLAYSLIEQLMSAGFIPQPPSLSQYVS